MMGTELRAKENPAGPQQSLMPVHLDPEVAALYLTSHRYMAHSHTCNIHPHMGVISLPSEFGAQNDCLSVG